MSRQMNRSDKLLQRILHRANGGGFCIFVLEELKRAASLPNRQRRILERATELLTELVEDSQQLEHLLEVEMAAHMRERRVSLQLDRERADFKQRAEVAERQLAELWEAVDSGEILGHGKGES